MINNLKENSNIMDEETRNSNTNEESDDDSMDDLLDYD